MTNEKKMTRTLPPLDMYAKVQTIFGCKWSLTVYILIRNGVCRPGEMVRSVEGLTTKVLNTCLKKNVEFGILEKKVFPEIPPRVEYVITPFGEKFVGVIEQISELGADVKS